MSKECLECGEKVIGREDKKFCNDACRNAYNNKLNKNTTNLMRNTNNQLRKNYRILTELNTNDKTTINRSRLSLVGFDFQLYTSIYTTQNNTIYYFVYDQGYRLLENDWYVLVKRK